MRAVCCVEGFDVVQAAMDVARVQEYEDQVAPLRFMRRWSEDEYGDGTDTDTMVATEEITGKLRSF